MFTAQWRPESICPIFEASFIRNATISEGAHFSEKKTNLICVMQQTNKFEGNRLNSKEIGEKLRRKNLNFVKSLKSLK